MDERHHRSYSQVDGVISQEAMQMSLEEVKAGLHHVRLIVICNSTIGHF